MRSGMVLAAGLGTRLRPLTDELPKPLVPLGDGTPLGRAVERLRHAGCARVIVNAHHHLAEMERAASALGVDLASEARILGTAGGVANARALLGDSTVLLWNADIVADVDLAALGRALHGAGASAAWAVAPRPRGEGTVGLDAGGIVVRLRDVRVGDEAAGGDFLGISALSAALVAALPVEGCLVGDVLAPMVARGGRIATVTHAGPWDDLGTPARYLAANLRWLAERGETSFVGVDADPGAAELDRTVLGDGARVTGAGALRRVVVWPGAVVRAPLANAIVTRAGVVKVG